MKEELIKLVNVSKIYDNGKTIALDNVNLVLPEHKMIAIYGQSGSGKTTLLNLIGALDKPTKGEVYIDGRDILKLNQNELANLRNKKIGFVFQFHYLISEFTVLENIILPALIYKKNIRINEIKEKAINLAKFLEIDNVLNKYPDFISGGQRQRAAICRALINNPKIVLADEPTGNLDSKNTEKVFNLFLNLNKEYKTTIIIITHNQEIADKCDIKIELKDGKVINYFSK